MSAAANSNSQAVLADLAREINEHETSRRACEVKGLMHGFRIGQLLLKAKAVTTHGKFLDWAKANTSVTPRMCQFYMRAARDPRLQWELEHEYETVSHLTLTAAIKLDRQPKDREDKARLAMAKAIAAKWEAHKEIRRRYVDCLGEVRQALREEGDNDETFKAWLVENAGVGPAFADNLPDMLDQEYDDAVWTDAVFDDVLAGLKGGKLP